MKNNQNGRSMIEMLGVLAVVGVLSVGGLNMVNKARYDNKVASLLSGISSLGSAMLQQRNYVSEINDANGYKGNFVKYLKQIGKLPTEFTYDGTSLKTEMGNTITAQTDATNEVVVVTVSGLDKNTCIRIASNEWGSYQTNRFIGLVIGASGNFNCVAAANCASSATSAFAGKTGYPMGIATATAACNSATIIKLGYKI